jgi:heterodisulfide reductase subunit C
MSDAPLRLDTGFLGAIERRSGQPIARCYQCRKCSAGCPTAQAMDFDPAQIVRLVQLGQRQAALSCAGIWLCVGCETCGTRCPNGICVGRIADALKASALQAGVAPGERSVYQFHRAFLNSVRRFGRAHEITMLVEYKLRAGNLLADLLLGARLLLAGKLPLLPGRLSPRRGVAPLFRIAGTRRRDEDSL